MGYKLDETLTALSVEQGTAVAFEAKRLAEKYNKDFFDAKDLIQIMGVGTNNIRALLNSSSFPTVTIGNRKVVSVLAFVLWSSRPTA